MNRLSFSSNHTVRLLIPLVLIASTILFEYQAFGQIQFDYPLRMENTFVYRSHTQNGKTNPAKIEIIFGERRYEKDTLPVSVCNLYRYAGEYYRTITKDRRLVEYVPGSGPMEIFPLDPPTTDTFYLRGLIKWKKDSLKCSITQRFDTLLFSQRVSAFSFLFSDSFGRSTERTIADRFGLICTVERNGITSYDSLILHSCKIDGVGYNRESRKSKWISLCLGNEFQYHFRKLNLHTSGVIDRRDSFRVKTQITLGTNSYYDGTLYGFLRESNDSIFRWNPDLSREELLIEPTATIGSFVRRHSGHAWGLVYDTGSVFLEGKLRRKLVIQIRDDDLPQTWIEGFGLHTSIVLTADDYIYYNLEKYRICGVNGIKPWTSTRENTFRLQNHPNPFSNTTSITYYLNTPAHVRLEIFDAFGRNISTLVDDQHEAGEHQARFDAKNLTAGVYFYRLSVGSSTQTKKMILMP